MKNLSDLRICEEKQTKQKKQKTISFLEETKESEAIIHLKKKEQS